MFAMTQYFWYHIAIDWPSWSESTGNNFAISKNDVNEVQKSKKKRAKRAYIPSYRSGAYGILVGLYKGMKKECYINNDGLNKTQLINEASEYSNSSYTITNSKDSFFTAWNSMKTLLNKVSHRVV